MKHLDEIIDLIEYELSDVAKNGKFKSHDEVHMVYELIDIAKDIYCIWNYEDGDNNYSEMPHPYYQNSYDNDESYARGRNARRDSMGRYSSRRSYYSRANAKDDFVEDLTKLMHKAPNEEVQHEIQSLIQHIERE